MLSVFQLLAVRLRENRQARGTGSRSLETCPGDFGQATAPRALTRTRGSGNERLSRSTLSNMEGGFARTAQGRRALRIDADRPSSASKVQCLRGRAEGQADWRQHLPGRADIGVAPSLLLRAGPGTYLNWSESFVILRGGGRIRLGVADVDEQELRTL